MINPYYLYVFFRGNPNVAWQQTATCFLALTGAEASYADLGHFSVASMRVSISLRLTFGAKCCFTAAPWLCLKIQWLIWVR